MMIGETHCFCLPIPLVPLESILPNLKMDGLRAADDGSWLVGDTTGSFGSAEYRNFAHRVYCMLTSDRAIQDAQFARGRRRLEGRVLVDLGPGTNRFGYHLACAVAAAGYVAVEPYFANELVAALQSGEPVPVGWADTFRQVPLTGRQVPAAVVKEHATTFLDRLLPGSVSLLVSGLDRYVLSDAYLAGLNEAIERVTHIQGVCLALKSAIRPPNLTLETVSAGDDFDYFYPAS